MCYHVKLDVVTHVGRGLFLDGQPRPTPRGRGPSAPQFLGSFLFMRTAFDAELLNLMWWYIWGRGFFLGVSHAPTSRGGIPALPNFGALLYLCLHPLTQNDQIRHGNTGGEGRVLGGQPRHCICTNASRGLSAIAEFLVMSSQLMWFCYVSCNMAEACWRLVAQQMKWNEMKWSCIFFHRHLLPWVHA